MLDVKVIISSIEEMEKQKNEAMKDANELRIKVWQLEQELKEKEKEVESWKKLCQK